MERLLNHLFICFIQYHLLNTYLLLTPSSPSLNLTSTFPPQFLANLPPNLLFSLPQPPPPIFCRATLAKVLVTWSLISGSERKIVIGCRFEILQIGKGSEYSCIYVRRRLMRFSTKDLFSIRAFIHQTLDCYARSISVKIIYMYKYIYIYSLTTKLLVFEYFR